MSFRIQASESPPRHSKDIDQLLSVIVEKVLVDEKLPPRNRDHELSGNWKGLRKEDLMALIHSNSASN